MRVGAVTGDSTRPQRRFAGRTVAVFVFALVAALLFAVVVLLVRTSDNALLRVDRSITANLHRFVVHRHGFVRVMKFLSTIGTSTAWTVIFVVVAAWLLYRRLYRLTIFVAVTAIGSSLLNNLIKILVDRARPHVLDPVAVAGGKSFPSGHAQAAIVGYGILVAVFLPAIGRRWRPWFTAAAAVMVGLIGFSRIALGVHYLSDVVGGYLIGLVWLLGMISAFRAWRRDEGKPTAGLDEGLEPESSERLG